MNRVCLAPKAQHLQEAWGNAPGFRPFPRTLALKARFTVRTESRFQRFGVPTIGFLGRCPRLKMTQHRWRQQSMILRKFLAVVVLVGIAGLSSAAPAKEIYKFDQSGSTIGFSVHQFLGTTRGKFTNFSGRIEVDREHPENSSVTAQIDVRSLDTRIKKRDDHLRSAEFFNVEKFPNMTFRSRSVKRTGPQSGDILGDLTMHGVTKPVTLHVKLLTPVNEASRTRWAVTIDPIDRRNFNLMFAPATETISGISQTVAINIEIEAKRAD
jgi:polyisoprenoid-binding protein YceI